MTFESLIFKRMHPLFLNFHVLTVLHEELIGALIGRKGALAHSIVTEQIAFNRESTRNISEEKND